MRLAIWGWCAALGAAALSVSTPASAFVQENNRSFAEGYGNSNVFGGFSVSSTQSNASGTVGVVVPGGLDIRSYLRSTAGQAVDTSVKFLGVSAKPFTASLKAQGYWQYEPDTGGVYSPTTSAKIVVLGNTVYSSSGTACAGSKRCVEADKTYEKEFVKGSFFWVVFGVTVELQGAVIGSVGAGLSANASASKYLVKNSLLSRTNAGWGARAALTVAFDGCIGICDTLGVSIEPRFNVLQLDVGPKSSSAQGTSMTGNAKYNGTNTAGITLTTMNGKLTARADYVLGHAAKELVRWSGYSDSWDLWSDNPSFVCEDYISRPSSDCQHFGP